MEAERTTSSRSQMQISRHTPSLSPPSSSLAQLRPGRVSGFPTVTPDTPMGLYLAARNRPRTRRSFHRQYSGQVPLAALRPIPGSFGGTFCSTTKTKCVPLPNLFNHHHLMPNSLRNVPLHAQRYTPPSVTPFRVPVPTVVSYSLANLHKPGSSRQQDHLKERETLVKKSRSLQRASGVTPHRLSWAFYMSGEPAQIFDKEEIPAEELRILQQLTLSQNPALYYGTGIKSSSGQASRQVARFERQLQDTVEEMAKIYEYRELMTAESDVRGGGGRYSSRNRTPASPILEESGDMATPPPSPLPPGQETFLTENT